MSLLHTISIEGAKTINKHKSNYGLLTFGPSLMMIAIFLNYLLDEEALKLNITTSSAGDTQGYYIS